MAQLELVYADDQGVEARHLGWSPVRCVLRDSGVGEQREVVISQRSTASSGRLRLGRTAVDADELRATLPASGDSLPFVVAGEFGRPSTAEGDVDIVVTDATGELARFPVMVRIRKNADALTAAERDRFLAAIATLNDQGRGDFQSFRDTHTDATKAQAHFGAAFLPWHRAFLLDLERELQQIDSSVALPYWRFDLASPRVFRADFMGVSDGENQPLRFSPTNPLEGWVTDSLPGVARHPIFNTQAVGAPVLGEEPITLFNGAFADIPGLANGFEYDPHGLAHTSFDGLIQQIDTAARDPLFYLLHCNVDRLWAKWQWTQRRRDPDDEASFGGTPPEGSRAPGHNREDTMWPWNGQVSRPRPPVAPRQPFPGGVGITAPGRMPRVRSMIDYQGVLDPGSRLGFDYDDVPFEV